MATKLQPGDLVEWTGKDKEQFFGELMALTTVDQKGIVKRYDLREDGQLLPMQSGLVSVPLPKLSKTRRTVFGGHGAATTAQMSDTQFIQWARQRTGLSGSVADLSGSSGVVSSEPTDEDFVAALHSGRDGSVDVGTPTVAADADLTEEDEIGDLAGVSDEQFLQALAAVRNG